MSRRLLCILGGAVLSLTAAGAALAQTQTTTTATQTTAVQNADGSWTVVEYPVDKEVTVDLTPNGIANATGRAVIHRMADGTSINLNLSGLPNDVSSLNLYAVDAAGRTTLLGPVAISNGVATYNTMTPLNKFMLVLSPEANLGAYTPQTNVIFRSAAPQGFAVVPLASYGERDGAPVGERVSATSTSGATPGYVAPMLGIPGFRRGTDTEVKIKFAGAMTGARANIFLEPRKDGPTTIKMRFHELKEAPAGEVYAVWAVSPDNKYVKLGQIVNTGQLNEAQIQTETALTDFGLLITLENEPMTPTGAVVGTILR